MNVGAERGAPGGVSIEIVSMGEDSLWSVLESLRAQTTSDISVVCAEASGNSETRERIAAYGCKVVSMPRGTKLLRARKMAHDAGRGAFSLILDSTRTVEPKCLATLMSRYSAYQAVVVREDTTGEGKLAELEQLDKEIVYSGASVSHALTHREGTVLPRFFSFSMLSNVLSALETTLGESRFSQIRYGDHHLISVEAMNQGAKFGVTKELLIHHRADSTLGRTIRKYFAYGVSQTAVSDLAVYGELNALRGHRRRYDDVPLTSRLRVTPLYALRTGSFLLGNAWGLLGLNGHERRAAPPAS